MLAVKAKGMAKLRIQRLNFSEGEILPATYNNTIKMEAIILKYLTKKGCFILFCLILIDSNEWRLRYTSEQREYKNSTI